MDIESRDNGTVKIFMKEYIKESILTFDVIVKKSVNDPTKHDLFTVGESKFLDQVKGEKFHCIVAK